MNELYNLLLEYIENDNDQSLLSFFEKQNPFENDDEIFKEFFKTISKISKNHQRSMNFSYKIETLFLRFEEKIKQTFSIPEIILIFKKNKNILYFLVQKRIINFKELNDYIQYKHDRSLEAFFLLEIKNMEADSDFYEKRKIGENENYICDLIRKDLIDDFIIQVNKTDSQLSDIRIRPSQFETNSFLINKILTLIEYAAFYGSIKIFKYLILNKVCLKPSLWLCAIHGNNPEIICYLVENNIQPKDVSYKECFIEAVKCHHNSVAEYIRNNLMTGTNDDELKDYNNNLVRSYFQYHNYNFIPENVNSNFIFFPACEFGYFNIVSHFLQINGFNINAKIIQNKHFVIKFQCYQI